MIRRPPSSTQSRSSAASDVYKRQVFPFERVPGADSDLRIEVWAIDPEDSSNDLLLDSCDSKADNVEHIHVPMLAEYRVYELVVSYADGAGQTAVMSEPYGLAWAVAEKPGLQSILWHDLNACLLYTSPSPRDRTRSRMPSSA